MKDTGYIISTQIFKVITFTSHFFPVLYINAKNTCTTLIRYKYMDSPTIHSAHTITLKNKIECIVMSTIINLFENF